MISGRTDSENREALGKQAVAKEAINLLCVDALGAVDHRHDHPGVGMVQGELSGDAIGSAGETPAMVVEAGMGRHPGVQHAIVADQRVDLIDEPALGRLVVPIEDPVEGEVGPIGDVFDDRALLEVAENLERAGGYEAAPLAVGRRRDSLSAS